MPKCKGKAMWAYTKTADLKYGEWKINVYYDSVEAKKLIDLGLKKQVRRVDPLMDPDGAALGEYWTKFSRSTERKGKGAGKKNQKPEVVNADNEPFDEIIGNGSDVVVRFNIYNWTHAKYGQGIGIDLDGVKVINNVQYVAPDMKADTDVPVEVAEEEKW